MSKRNNSKKTAQKDWHKADIKAALEKAGWTFRSLSRHHGYKSSTTLHRVLHVKWPKGQKLVADAIGKTPEEIWPSRYQKALENREAA